MSMLYDESYIGIYKSIIRNNPDPAIVLSVDGTLTEVNQSVTELFGYAKEEVQGFSYQKMIPPKQREKITRYFSQALQGTSSEHLMDVFHKSGDILHLQVKFIPLIVKEKVIGVFCVGKDITKLRKDEAYLCEIEERSKSLFKYTADAVYILGLDGNVIDVNPAFEELYGWKRQELVGKPLPIIPDDLLSQHQNMIEKVEWGAAFTGVEVTRITKNGTVADVSLTFSPIYNGEGQVIAVSGIVRDITQLKNQIEEKYRQLTENISDLLCVVNLNGVIEYASPSYKFILGFAPESCVGNLVFHMIHPDDYADVKCTFIEMALTNQTKVMEFRYRHVNSHWIWVEAKGTPILNDEGNVCRIQIVARDITERKWFEEKFDYVSYYDALTGLPNRRLFERRLEQSIKEAASQGHKLAVMYLDMCKFKYINDTFGYDTGDKLLHQFAQRVQGCLRGADTLARQWGDDFTILLPEIELEQDALKVAERILSSLGQTWHISTHVVEMTFNIGIAFYPSDGNTRQELLKNAYRALHEAKEYGRNDFKTCAECKQ